VRDELFEYYEHELQFLRQMGAEFADKYPKVASRLVLEANRCEDPHVERLLEAFAFLTARIHLKIDDEFPEITESLIEVLYPHFLRPIPSMSVVEFNIDPEQGKLSTGLEIPRDTMLYSRPVDGVPCRFRTCYDTTLWPLAVTSAVWRSPERLSPPLKAPDAVAGCALQVSCLGDAQLQQLAPKKLQFYLNGESSVIHTLYELLFNNMLRVMVRNPNKPNQPGVVLPPGSLRAMGFTENEAMLPYPRRSFAGYRLLQEYFSFPEKFFFIELKNLELLANGNFDTAFEIVFLISRFERSDRQQSMEVNVKETTFELGCSPIINLFAKDAESILLEQTKFEYPIVPDFRRVNAMEVFSIEDVYTSSTEHAGIVHYEPFYSSHHGRAAQKDQTFWHATRRPSARQHDNGTEVYISLLDSSGQAWQRSGDSLTAKCICTNRDLPSRLPFGNEGGDFDLEGGSVVRRIVALRKPTPTVRPPVRRGLQWRLISHLSLNYLSLVDEGRAALQEVLRLYNYSESTSDERQIAGISSLKSSRHFARVVSEHGISFARGVRVHMEFDEEMFAGAGVFLFSAVLEYFLGIYSSLNSFSQLVVRTKQRKEVLREWRPRAGQRILL